MTDRKDIKAILKLAAKQGFLIKKNGRHYHVRNPQNGGLVIVSRSNSDNRGRSNTLSQLAKIGLVYRNPHGRYKGKARKFPKLDVKG